MKQQILSLAAEQRRQAQFMIDQAEKLEAIAAKMDQPELEFPQGCAACDRGDFQLGHRENCPKG